LGKTPENMMGTPAACGFAEDRVIVAAVTAVSVTNSSLLGRIYQHLFVHEHEWSRRG